MSYYETECFPLRELKARVKDNLYPFINIERKTIIRKDGRYRVQLTLTTRQGDKKNISLLLSIDRNDGKPPVYYVNNKSFDNITKSIQKINEMQKELDGIMENDPEKIDDEVTLHEPSLIDT